MAKRAYSDEDVYEGTVVDPSPGITKTEPALTVGTAIGLVGAVFVLLRLYFPDVFTPELEDAISGILLIGLPLVLAVIVRAKVTSNARVVERATATGYVVAGDANEALMPGDIVRTVGELYPGFGEEGEPLEVNPSAYVKDELPHTDLQG